VASILLFAVMGPAAGKPLRAGWVAMTGGPLGQQARLGDFWIPQRGALVIDRAFFSDS
jgi:hypothetical protein